MTSLEFNMFKAERIISLYPLSQSTLLKWAELCSLWVHMLKPLLWYLRMCVYSETGYFKEVFKLNWGHWGGPSPGSKTAVLLRRGARTWALTEGRPPKHRELQPPTGLRDRPQTLLTFWSLTCGLQNCEQIRFCCLSPQVDILCYDSLRKPIYLPY